MTKTIASNPGNLLGTLAIASLLIWDLSLFLRIVTL